MFTLSSSSQALGTCKAYSHSISYLTQVSLLLDVKQDTCVATSERMPAKEQQLASLKPQCHAIRAKLMTRKVLPVLLHAVPPAYPASLTYACQHQTLQCSGAVQVQAATVPSTCYETHQHLYGFLRHCAGCIKRQPDWWLESIHQPISNQSTHMSTLCRKQSSLDTLTCCEWIPSDAQSPV